MKKQIINRIVILMWVSLISLQSSLSLSGQSEFRGRVLRADNSAPIPACTVIDPESGHFDITDEEGLFRIEVEGDSLRFLAFSYHTETVPVDSAVKDMTVYLEQLSYTLDQYVEVIGSRNFQIAGNYSHLDKSRIPSNLPNSVADALNTVPGVFMHTASLNTNRITIRGIGNRSLFATSKIKAFLGDIPLTSGIGESSIEDIDFNLVEQVDIFKGPAGSRYGASLGGVLYMKPDLFPDQTQSSFELKTNAGSYGQFSTGEYVSLKNAEQGYTFLFGHNYLHNDGYRENNEYNRHNVTTMAQYNKNDHQLNLFGSFISLKAFIPSSLDYEDYINNPRVAAQSWADIMGFEDYDKFLIGLSHRYDLSPVLSLKTSFHVNARDSYEPRPFNILSEDSRAVSGRASVEWSDFFSGKSDAIFGVEWFREDYDWKTFETLQEGMGQLLSDNHEDRLYVNIYGEQKIRLNSDWTAEWGLNLNSTKYELTDLFEADGVDYSGEYSFETILSPEFSLAYNPGFNQIYFLRASHGFSTPTTEETLTPEGQINPEIQPEKVWNLEVGTKSLGKRLSYDISVFRMWVNDLLVARRTDFDQFVGVNAGQTRHDGAEFQLSYDLIHTEHSRFNSVISYQYSDFKFVDFVDNNEDHSGNDLTGTPPHLFTGLLQLTYKNWYSKAVYRYVDEMPLRDDNSVYSSSSQVVDFELAYNGKWSEKTQYSLTFKINNILNEKYASMYSINASAFGNIQPRYYYPGLPRNVYFALSIRYSL